MTTGFERPSAQIYQFPLGGRAVLARRRDETRSAAEPTPASTPAIAAGSGWYHEAAMQEADRSRKS
ncbi:DUF2735 domain-containing protein [Chelatococcus reniformis]|uniref:DUF2735 domain-containing protein n=1 Tax=Chelatococcus reniformis TaxID=1494448 RepID=A0A916XBY7_9HYPH|nr:DUF2735 domain-containing protein [Chelatococcus reniformis]GGC60572.1 hypothetical protein GCM10010994_19010 [Chelatococcus reniformis]